MNTKTMTEWLQKNGFAIAIALLGVVSTYSINTALYGYRLTAVEQRQDRQGTAIMALQTGDTTTQVALAKIQTQLQFIQDQIAKVLSK